MHERRQRHESTSFENREGWAARRTYHVLTTKYLLAVAKALLACYSRGSFKSGPPVGNR